MAEQTVVLLPPLGLDARVYEPLAAALAARVRVETLDYPGFGADDAELDGADGDVLGALARYVERTLRARGVAPTILGGISLGGTLSLMLASRLRPAALLLMAPGGLPVTAARRGVVLGAMGEHTPLEFARRSIGIDADTFAGSGLEAHFPSQRANARTYFEHLTRVVWSPERAEARARAYAALLSGALAVDLSRELATNAIPADLVWGADDRVFSRRTYEKYAKALRASTFHLLPGVGHFPPLEAPQGVADIVLRRLDRLAGPASSARLGGRGGHVRGQG